MSFTKADRIFIGINIILVLLMLAISQRAEAENYAYTGHEGRWTQTNASAILCITHPPRLSTMRKSCGF